MQNFNQTVNYYYYLKHALFKNLCLALVIAAKVYLILMDCPFLQPCQTVFFTQWQRQGCKILTQFNV